MGFSAVQDPQAVIQRTFDWTSWLSDGETITTATVTADTGFTVANVTHDDTTVTFTGSGGTAGQRYKITCHVVTTAGEENDKTLTIDIADR